MQYTCDTLKRTSRTMPTSRPLAVIIIACVYILTGAFGFAAHLGDLRVPQFDGIGVELIRLLAVVAGVFLLLGRNWARWLALAWMAFHVVISIFNSLGQVAVHGAFLAVIAWFLFRPEVSWYFHGRDGIR